MDASFSGKSDTVINIHPTDKEAVENWRGLPIPPKKRKKSSYLAPCPEWLHADPSMRGKTQSGPVEKWKQPPPAGEIHLHKGSEFTGLHTEGRANPNRCTMPHLIEKSMTKRACVSLTKQCSSQYCGLSQQVTREIPFVCTSVAVLLAWLTFRLWCKKALTFWSPPASGQSKVCHSVPLQSRQIRKFSESFSQLQFGRTYVD